jgi:hypothetical protein
VKEVKVVRERPREVDAGVDDFLSALGDEDVQIVVNPPVDPVEAEQDKKKKKKKKIAANASQPMVRRLVCF